ncbi:MAG: hypothetical protein COB02_15770 [Candidatus Cloacimonadota bacterium]|nr:MAG: hypothetical protein COB02_15770 [Candidatus Cloacimonadota bacterium]
MTRMKEISKQTYLQDFPLGASDFETIRQKKLLYIDKTDYIHNLIKTSEACFIARPRRFGKSLVISTLEAIFKGKKNLFEGLSISTTPRKGQMYLFEEFPVIRLDLSSIKISNKEECKNLMHKLLLKQVKLYGFDKEIKSYSSFLEEFYDHVQKKIVILVDEYDKPVLDNITQENVLEIQKELSSFFGATKICNKYIQFLFITGITKLSNANMFSEGNHIIDLGRNEKFDSMFGYTQEELETQFKPYIEVLSQKENTSYNETLINIKKYYNGYTFSESEKSIYNPYSILQLFNENRFDNYWFNSGTPTFVLELIKDREFDISNKTELEYGEDLFDPSQASKLTVKNILFQAGYLTIKKDQFGEKQLVFPNIEVHDSFYRFFISFFTDRKINYSRHLKSIKNVFLSKDWDSLQEVLNDYFDEFTYETTGSENLYHSLTFALLKLTGFKVISEVLTKKGRIDQYLETKNDIYIIEYKYKSSSVKAMQQIVDRKYFKKYMNTDKNIYLIGINFEKDGQIKDEILIINPRDEKSLKGFMDQK